MEGAATHEAVRGNPQRLPANRDFVAEQCGPNAEPGIRTIYRAGNTDFNVLVHVPADGMKGPWSQ